MKYGGVTSSKYNLRISVFYAARINKGICMHLSMYMHVISLKRIFATGSQAYRQMYSNTHRNKEHHFKILGVFFFTAFRLRCH